MTLRPSLDAVRAAADDDTPRLAFAAALSDEAWATWIRLQCAFERAGVDDDERPDIEADLARASFPKSWAASLEGAGVAKVSHYAVRRGFLEHVVAPASVLLERGAALAEEHPIRSIAIDRLSEPAAVALATQSWLRNVDSLTVVLADPHATVPTPTLTSLLSSPHLRLRRLWVAVAPQDFASLLALPSLADLTALRVGSPSSRADAVAAALAEGAPPSLEELQLGDAGPALGTMMRSPRLARLQSLAPGDIDVEGARALADHPLLESLVVPLFHPSDEAAAVIVESVLPRLLKLSLGRLGERAAASLVGRSAPMLAELALHKAPAPLRALGSLDAPRLRRLLLFQCGFDVATVEALSGMRAADLVALDLADRPSEGAVQALSAAPFAKRLRTLMLECGDAPLDDVRAVASAGLTQLRRLSVANAPREADADLGLAAMTTPGSLPDLRLLRYLYAGNRPSFGRAGAEALLASPGRLGVLFANVTGVPAGLKKRLLARFAVTHADEWTSTRLPLVNRGYLAA